MEVMTLVATTQNEWVERHLLPSCSQCPVHTALPSCLLLVLCSCLHIDIYSKQEYVTRGPLWRHGQVSCCVNGVLHMTDRRSRSLHWSLCVLAFRDFAVSIFYCHRGQVAFWGMTLHCWVWQDCGQEPANVFLSLCTPLKVPYLTNFEALGFLKIPAGQRQSINEKKTI